MENILFTKGYLQQNLQLLQYQNMQSIQIIRQKRSFDSVGSIEQFKSVILQKRDTLKVDRIYQQKRKSAQDHNYMQTKHIDQENDNPIQNNSNQQHNHKKSIINILPTDIPPPQQKILPHIQLTRSKSEQNNLKRIQPNKSQFFNKTRSKSGYLSLTNLPSRQQSLATTNYSTLQNSLLVNSLTCSAFQDTSNKFNNPDINNKDTPEKLHQFLKITNNFAPHTDRQSKFRALCENKCKTVKQSAQQNAKASEGQQSLLYSKYNSQVQPFNARIRGVSVTENSPFARLYQKRRQNSTVESYFTTENTVTKGTQITDNHSSLLNTSIDSVDNSAEQTINQKDVDRDLALSLKKLQFDKYFPESALTKKLKTYYESIQKEFIEEQRKQLEIIKRVDIPQHQRVIIRMIRNAMKNENTDQKLSTSYNFNNPNKKLI